MRYVQAGVMLFGSAAYLGFAVLSSSFAPHNDYTAILLAIGGWNVLLLIVAALAIVDGIRKLRAGKTRVLATDAIVVKLAAVPFFLINFIVLTTIAFFGSAFAALSSALADFGRFALVGTAITVALTYLAMLTTTPYAWAAIDGLRRDGSIRGWLAVLYKLLLFVFGADVVVGILVYVHSRRAQAALTPVAEAGTEMELARRQLPTVRSVQVGTLLLGAVMYALDIAFVDQLSSADNVPIDFFMVGGWNTILLVVTALVVIDSIRKVRAGKTHELATDVFVVKLAAIPFFLLNFYVLAFLFVGGFGILIFGGGILIIASWIGGGLTYLTMLSTSIYAWGAIARLRRDHVISTGLAVLYMLLSFVFVTDVAAGILLFGHSRRRPGLALVFVLVGLGLAFGAFGLALPGFIGHDSFQPDLSWLIISGGVLIVAPIVIALVRTLILRRRVRATTVDTASHPAHE